jgi:hypothetical protein
MSYALLNAIEQFAKSLESSNIRVRNSVVQEITSLVREKLALHDQVMMTILPAPQTASQMNVPQPTLGMRHPFSLDQVKALDIAVSLSVIKGDYYGKISQADYISHLRGRPITKHIECAIGL